MADSKNPELQGKFNQAAAKGFATATLAIAAMFPGQQANAEPVAPVQAATTVKSIDDLAPEKSKAVVKEYMACHDQAQKLLDKMMQTAPKWDGSSKWALPYAKGKAAAWNGACMEDVNKRNGIEPQSSKPPSPPKR